MIITPSGPQWTSLARRGMLWSEVQVFDVSIVEPGGPGPVLDPDCYELLYCAAGSCTLSSPAGGPTLRLLAGQCVVLAPGSNAITAGRGGSTLVRARALPLATSGGLPARRPSLEAAP